MTKILKIPVLTLDNVVFFPNTSLPLYVVDPVFEELIEQAAAEGTPIGIALSRDPYSDANHLKPHYVCGIGHPIILERLEDGVLKVLVKGIGRAQLLEVEQHLPFPVYNAKRIYDDTEPCEFLDEKIVRLKEVLDSWLKINVTNEVERKQFLTTMTSDAHYIDYIATFIIQDFDLRQLLLENTSFVERVNLIDTLIKDHNPYQEDYSTRNAILGYESIERVAKCPH